MGDWTDSLVDIIFKSSFMTLATADTDGLPWASPVEFACDEALRFYWSSVITARHSQNIRGNPRVALAIYDSTQTPGVLGEVAGLYAEGSVEELGPSDLERVGPAIARWVSWRDAGRTTPRTQSEGRNAPDTPWRVYRVQPTQISALNPVQSRERSVDWRVPVDLGESFARAYHRRLEQEREAHRA